jgi:lipopolysaccharide transport system ATP-binding protein
MAAVNNLCNKGVILEFGKVLAQGSTHSIIEKYINSNTEYSGIKHSKDIIFNQVNPNLIIRSVSLRGQKGINTDFGLEEDICCEIEYSVTSSSTTVVPSIHLLDKYGECILATFNANSASLQIDPLFNKVLSKGIYKTSCTLPANFLNEGSYKISVFLSNDMSFTNMTVAQEVLTFQTHDTGEMSKDYLNSWIGLVRPKLFWKSEKLNSSI